MAMMNTSDHHLNQPQLAQLAGCNLARRVPVESVEQDSRMLGDPLVRLARPLIMTVRTQSILIQSYTPHVIHPKYLISPPRLSNELSQVEEELDDLKPSPAKPLPKRLQVTGLD